MSIREQIAALEELSAVDVELRRVEEQLDKQQTGLSGMRSEVKGLEDRIAADRETMSAMDRTRSDLVGELRQMTNQIERSREKLGRARNERESNAAQREVEELRKLHRDREEDLERLNTAADQAKAAIDEADKKRAALTSELTGSADGIATSLGELSGEKARLVAERAKAVAKLPTALYRRYESIRTRRPVAIARTHDGTCQGCHLSVPPMMFQKMRRQEEFEQCPNCRRILYYVPLEATPPASS
ncbi:MAG: C4-type zinc ribbon domain-containing protein [Minicystis sp.]